MVNKIGNGCVFVKGVVAKSGLLGIRIMCPSGAIGLSADCYINELVL